MPAHLVAAAPLVEASEVAEVAALCVPVVVATEVAEVAPRYYLRSWLSAALLGEVEVQASSVPSESFQQQARGYLSDGNRLPWRDFSL